MNGKKTKRILCTLGILATVFLSGCTRFDAASYVQAVLDASYKGKTEQYIEVTGGSKEDAQKVFRKKLDATMAEFKETKLPEELEVKYETLFGDLMKQMYYKVGESQKEENGSYAVTVTAKPILLFDETYEEFQKRAEMYAKEVTDQVTKSGEMPTEETMQQEVYRIYYGVLNEQMETGISYGDAKEVQIHVIRQKDGTYELAGQDLIALDALLISQEKLTKNDADLTDSEQADSTDSAASLDKTERQ